MSETILSVNNLETTFSVEDGTIKVLDGISFSLKKGETLGIVGESGCGKSVTSLSVMGLLPRPHGKITAGQILYKGTDLVSLPPEELYKMRGDAISMIFQEPMTALNPVHTVGQQICEVYKLHRKEFSAEERKKRTIDMLKKAGIPAPEKRFNEYPHQLSGGMRQRVMIAMALACKPDILIADEPTTALDVTIQAQILDLIKQLQQETNMSVLFITHDLGVVAEVCDRVIVMYGGQIVEQADVKTLFKNPQHPYTKGLLASIPKLDSPSRQPLPTIEGTVPSLSDMPPGCRFQNRCSAKVDDCSNFKNNLMPISPGHLVSCIHVGRVSQ